MDGKKRKLILSVTGASGSIYASRLLTRLEGISGQVEAVGVIFSRNARVIWEHELDAPPQINWPVYEPDDFSAPFASGSAGWDAMIACPCSMGFLGRVASGVSDDLATRAADVVLKERKKLVLVTRETPLSMIHINSMRAVTLAGGVVCPAVPSFYSRPRSMEELADTVVDRALELAGFCVETYRWNGLDKPGG